MKCNRCNNTLYGDQYKAHHLVCFQSARNKRVRKNLGAKKKVKKNNHLVSVNEGKYQKYLKIDALVKKHGIDFFLKEKKDNNLKTVIKNKSSFFDSREWQELRYLTLKRYGFKCMCCNATNTELHVDHIKPRKNYPHLALDPENLQVLCRACNMGKSYKHDDDFRNKQEKSESLTR
jgi:hypothetical protein